MEKTIVFTGNTHEAIINGEQRIVTAIILNDEDGNCGPGIKTFNSKGEEVMSSWGEIRRFTQAPHLFKALKIIEEIKNFDEIGKIDKIVEPLRFFRKFFNKQEKKESVLSIKSSCFDRRLFYTVYKVAYFAKHKNENDCEDDLRIIKLIGQKKLDEIRLMPVDPIVVEKIENYIHS